MTTKYVQPGGKIVYSNSGSAISSGDVVVIGNDIGVAEDDIAATTGSGTVNLEGVYELAKVSGTAFSQGDDLYWDSSQEELTKTASGNTYIGRCHEDAESSAVLANVKLKGTNLGAQAAHVADLAVTDLSTSDTYTDAALNSRFAEVETTVNGIISALEDAGLMATS